MIQIYFFYLYNSQKYFLCHYLLKMSQRIGEFFAEANKNHFFISKKTHWIWTLLNFFLSFWFKSKSCILLTNIKRYRMHNHKWFKFNHHKMNEAFVIFLKDYECNIFTIFFLLLSSFWKIFYSLKFFENSTIFRVKQCPSNLLQVKSKMNQVEVRRKKRKLSYFLKNINIWQIFS